MIPTEGKKDMSFDEWLLYGITRNWSTAPICETHDGFAKTTSEKDSNDCVHYIRLYKNEEAFHEVIEEIPAATWRAFTRNLEWDD